MKPSFAPCMGESSFLSSLKLLLDQGRKPSCVSQGLEQAREDLLDSWLRHSSFTSLQLRSQAPVETLGCIPDRIHCSGLAATLSLFF